MNILVWILQILLGIHTIIGAVWKFSNPEQTVPSLAAIPHGGWLALSVIEIICGVFLIVPAFKGKFAHLAPFGAMIVALEMLLFCGVHLASGAPEKSPMIYWLIVAIIAGFIAAYRLANRVKQS
ncbi:MAG: DoxX family protein [Bdellovibrio sp.]|nr:DoxX family protein [Bdellovibrio sp.]